MEPLGPKLRRQRRRLGLTLDELAGRTAISKPYLSLIETGRVPNPPSDEKLKRLEQSLGFTRGELLTQAHLQKTPSDVRAVLGRLLDNRKPPSGSPHGRDEAAAFAGVYRELAASGGGAQAIGPKPVPVIQFTENSGASPHGEFPPKSGDQYL